MIHSAQSDRAMERNHVHVAGDEGTITESRILPSLSDQRAAIPSRSVIVLLIVLTGIPHHPPAGWIINHFPPDQVSTIVACHSCPDVRARGSTRSMPLPTGQPVSRRQAPRCQAGIMALEGRL